MNNYLRKERFKSAFLLFSSVVLLIFILLNINKFFSAVIKTINILMPLIIGCVIAFILNVPMKAVEKHLFVGKRFTGKKWDKRRRLLAVLMTIIIFLIVIVMMIALLIPQISDAITQITHIIPQNADTSYRDSVQIQLYWAECL